VEGEDEVDAEGGSAAAWGECSYGEEMGAAVAGWKKGKSNMES